MPYTQTLTYNTDVALYGDVTGTLNSTIVRSIANVSDGLLGLNNGGIGISSVPYGALLVGSSSTKLNYLTGSENDVLTWTYAHGWQPKNYDLKYVFSIILEENDLFSYTTSSAANNFSASFSIIEKTRNSVYASPISSSGKPTFRSLVSEDLPANITNKSFTDSIFTGSMSGSLYGSFSGSIELEEVSASFLTGDGSGIVNILGDNIYDLDIKINNFLESRVINLRDASIQSASIDYLYANGDFIGNFFGDGSSLYNLRSDAISDLSSVIANSFIAGNNVTILDGVISAKDQTKLSAEDSTIILTEFLGDTAESASTKIKVNSNLNILNLNSPTISSSYISSDSASFVKTTSTTISGSEIYGSFFGNAAGLTGISVDAIDRNYIIINNKLIKLGESASISGIAGITGDQNITSTNINGNVSLALKPELNINKLTSVDINSNTVSSSLFYGNGFNLTEIDANKIINLNNLITSSIKLDEQNILFNSDKEISLSQNIQVNSLNTNNIYTAGINAISGTYTSLTVDAITASNILISQIEIQSLQGDGSGLYNLRPNNIFGFSTAVRAAITGSSTILLNNGTASIRSVPVALIESSSIIINDYSASLGSKYYINNIGSIKTTGSVAPGRPYWMSGTTPVLADARYKSSSDIFGIASQNINGSYEFVNNGLVSSSQISSFAINENIYLGPTGSYSTFSNVPVGSYYILVGKKVDSDKISVSLKKMWKKG
jgi:hypothetical protein